MNTRFFVTITVFVFLFGPPSLPAKASKELPVVGTFSIVAYDPESGDLGVAVESKFLGVGAVVPWAKAGVGAIATQSWANTTYGPRGLELLEKGLSAQEVLDKLISEDKDKETRQVAVVDAQGRVVNFTGKQCFAWAGGIKGQYYAAQGNILVGEEVVKAMGRAFETTEGDLADKLLAALEAGQAAGGDSRGQQSAALLVVRKNAGYGGFNDRYIDIRVDDHPEPIKELRRIFKLYDETFIQRLGSRPLYQTRGNDVKQLKEMLRDLGYLQGEQNNVFDDRTAQAVIRFRQDRKLMGRGAFVDGQFIGELKKALKEKKQGDK